MLQAPQIDYDGRELVADHGAHLPHRIVWHDTESHDVAGIGDLAGIASYWHGVSWGPGAHLGIDADAYTARYVDDLRIGYHVENHNTGSLGIEIVGFASFGLRTWRLRRGQLEKVSWWTAWWSDRYGIPLRLDVEQGVSTHAMQSKAYHGSHTDPGAGFPVAKVLQRAIEIAKAGTPTPKPTPGYTPEDFWLWLRWELGEGEFKAQGPHRLEARPRRLPKRVPRRWWKRRDEYLIRRARSSRQPPKNPD